MTSREEIEAFINGKMEKDEILGEVTRSLHTLVTERYPNAVREIQYGGICYFDADLLVGGIFQSKKHVSFEFSEGGWMTDPDGLLEGAGKYRRHLKLRSIGDIEVKQVEFFLSQAFHE